MRAEIGGMRFVEKLDVLLYGKVCVFGSFITPEADVCGKARYDGLDRIFLRQGLPWRQSCARRKEEERQAQKSRSEAARLEAAHLHGLIPKFCDDFFTACGRTKALVEFFEDFGTDEGADISAQNSDFFDKARGDELVPVGCHQEDGFNLLTHAVVHASHLKLVFKIRNGAQATNDKLGPDFFGVVDQQIFKRQHFDAGAFFDQRRNFGFDKFDAGFGVKQRAFARVFGNADDELVHDLCRAADNFEMTMRDGVERARVQADAGFGRHGSDPLS